MISLKNDQRGLVGVVEALLIVVILALVGYTGTKVYNARKDISKTYDKVDSDSSKSHNFIALDEAKEIKEESEPEPEKPESAPVVTANPKTTTEPPKTETKPNYIKFSESSGNQQGSDIVVAAKLDSNQTGTCNFKFRKDGYEKVYVTSSISGSRDCNKTVPTSSFGVSGTWSFSVWFVSADKTTEAYLDAFNIEVTK